MDVVSGVGSRTDIAAGANSGSVAIHLRGGSMVWNFFQGIQINKRQLRDGYVVRRGLQDGHCSKCPLGVRGNLLRCLGVHGDLLHWLWVCGDLLCWLGVQGGPFGGDGSERSFGMETDDTRRMGVDWADCGADL